MVASVSPSAFTRARGSRSERHRNIVMRASTNFDVVAVGRAYVDEIFPNVDTAFLERKSIPIGNGRLCSINELNELSELFGSSVTQAGGSAANTSATVADLGGKAGFFCKVAQDRYGELFLYEFARQDIQTLCSPTVGGTQRTARCLVFCTTTPTPERSFACNNGCADYFRHEDFEHFDPARTNFLLIEGLLLQSPEASGFMQHLISLSAAKCRIAVSLHGTKNWKTHAHASRLIQDAAIVICGNALEQNDFQEANRLSFGTKDEQCIITTHGKIGATLQTQNEFLNFEAPHIEQAYITNTIGAGDAFLGGYLFAAASNQAHSECMKSAFQAAYHILKSHSGRPTKQ